MHGDSASKSNQGGKKAKNETSLIPCCCTTGGRENWSKCFYGCLELLVLLIFPNLVFMAKRWSDDVSILQEIWPVFLDNDMSSNTG